jgi:hypothetical protein
MTRSERRYKRRALHCIALHCIALHCIALHCIALHCIALLQQCRRRHHLAASDLAFPSQRTLCRPPAPTRHNAIALRGTTMRHANGIVTTLISNLIQHAASAGAAAEAHCSGCSRRSLQPLHVSAGASRTRFPTQRVQPRRRRLRTRPRAYECRNK